MSNPLLCILLGIVLAFSGQGVRNQQPVSVSISEPGVIRLIDLFQAADAVSLVRIVSGDTESYQTAVYKAEVLRSLKGPPSGEIIYFGPYIGSRLGGEYVLFLKKSSELAVPKDASKPGYGKVSLFRVFNEGYSSMETSYKCVFDGRDVNKQCDYGVRVCTDYIVLPKTLSTFPPLSESTPFGCRLVRKDKFIAAVAYFRDSGK